MNDERESGVSPGSLSWFPDQVIPTTIRPLLAVLCFGLAWLALPGCRREAPVAPDATPSLVRFADGLSAGAVTAAVDLTDADAALLSDAELLVDAPLGASASGIASHDGVWVDELFDGEGPLRLAWAPVEPSQRALWARVDASFDEADVALVFPVPQRNDAAAYADAEHAEKILRYLHALAIPMAARPGEDDVGRELATVLAADVREVLIAVRGRAVRSPEAHLRVAALGARGAWLGRTGRDVRSPWLRSVNIQGVTRPSIVLPAPAEVVQTIEVPEGEATARLDAARFFGAADPVRLTVTLATDDASATGRLELSRGATWSRLEFDVTGLSGGRARLTMEVADDPGAIVVVGDARIESGRPDPRPDVLLVSLDTVRADHVSVYGGPAENSPSLARFADTAVVFEQAIATAPWTLPSHASLFTGQYPDRHDVHRELSAVPRDLPWLVEDFRRAGYRTEAWTGGGYLDPSFGFDRGFDRYGTDDPAFPDRRWAARRGDAGLMNRADASAESRRELLARIGATDGGPRFLFVHTYAAHEYAASPELLLRFGAEEGELPELLESLSTVTLMNEIRRDPARAEDERLKARSRLLYRASLRTADDFLGEVLAALERSGRADRTIVVVTSDHGEELFERGAIGHAHQLYEELVHVPLLVRTPGGAPRRVSDVVSIADIAPTLRELCALRPSGATPFDELQDGRTLAPLLVGDRMPDRLALAHGSRPVGATESVFRALRGSRSKYMESEGAPGRLFDLREDPNERQDVTSARPDDARRSAAALETLVRGLSALRRSSGSATLSPEVKAGLEALGYLGGGERK